MQEEFSTTALRWLDAVIAAKSGGHARDGQRTMCEGVARSLSTGEHLLVEAPTGTGKALALDTPIPTPSGWSTMGELVPGDEVFDENGEVCRVLGVSPVMYDHECYEVEFSDGEVIVADAEHLWATATRALRFAQAERDRVERNPGALRRLLRVQRLESARAQLDDGSCMMSAAAAAEMIGQLPSDISRVRRNLGLPRLRSGELFDLRPVLDELSGEATRSCSLLNAPPAPYEITTTAEMAATLRTDDGALNHAVPVAAALELPDAETLPVEPYLLGLWLGDGTTTSGEITVGAADVQAIAALIEQRWSYVRRRSTSNGAFRLRLAQPAPDRCPYGHDTWKQARTRANRICQTCQSAGWSPDGVERWNEPFTTRLRRAGVLGAKRIPLGYLRASTSQRLEVLRGLMDSDGTVSRSSCSFTSCDPLLAADALELIRSLGIRAAVTSREAAITETGSDGARSRRVVGTRYTISFSSAVPVFHLPRKREAQEKLTARYNVSKHWYKYVTDIRPAPSVPVRCITVSSPDHLFLAGRSFTPTHNSLAYLVPALLWARELATIEADERAAGLIADDEPSSARILIATASKALQDQLVDMDVPLVTSVLADAGLSPRVTVLKGRSNYLCRARMADVTDGKASPFLDAAQLNAVLDWSETTAVGERSGFDAGCDDEVWDAVSISSDACPGAKRCPFSGDCFAEAARDRASNAQVVVVNTHLYAIDVAADRKVLPPHRAVIVDEAHELEDIAVSAFTLSLTAGRIGAVAKLARRAGVSPGICDAVSRAADAFSSAAAGLVGERVAAFDVPLVGPLNTLSTALRVMEDALEHATPDSDADQAAVAGAARLVGTLLEEVDLLCREDFADGRVSWVEGTADRPAFRSAPVDVAPQLAFGLYPSATTIATSATLCIGGEFRIPAQRLGLNIPAARTVGADPVPPAWAGLRVATPFDYPKQGLLYVARHLPDPRNAAFPAAAREHLAELTVAAGGRTLALFTSWQAARDAAEFLRSTTEMNVLLQGEAPRSALIDEFQNRPNSVLVATQSYWTGVDVPGSACFPAGTLVRTSRGYRPIEEVEIGDKVWTHRRRYRRVTAVMERRYEGELVEVSPYGSNPVRMTPEHPVLVSKFRRPSRNGPQTAVSLDWVPAGELTTKDALVLPIGDWFTGFRRIGARRLSGHRVAGRKVPAQWDESPEFWELVGLWAAEGSLVKEEKKYGKGPGRPRAHWSVVFSFGAHEESTLAQHAADLVAKVLGNKRPTPRVYGPGCVVRIKNDAFATWLRKNVGTGSASKRVPTRLLRSYEQSYKRAFLAGYEAGDGWRDQRDDARSASTVSRELALGVRDLALQSGFTAQVHAYVVHSGYVPGTPAWRVRWSPATTRASIVSRRGLEEETPFDRRFQVARPTKIARAPFTGTVFNLSVADDESYTLVPFAVHNCTLVVIDKIPFARPNDPLAQARREAAEAAGRNPFMDVDVPKASTLLAQAAGRLIRTVDDHGVVAVLDRRLAEARYKDVILASLPPFRRTVSAPSTMKGLRWLDEQAAAPAIELLAKAGLLAVEDPPVAVTA